MFTNASEKTLGKVYDWVTLTYYSPYPEWKEHETDERTQAIHALNDMRALYACVGNNGWWDEDRVLHLEELRDIIPYSMEQVLWQNERLEHYYKKREEKQEECERSGEEFNWDAFKEEHGTEIEKMQGNKDGKLYEYTKELFWDSVEWFLDMYGWWQEKKVLREILAAGESAAAE